MRLTPMLAVAVALGGCLGSGPFERCRGDDWPEWSAGSHAVTVCTGQREARASFLYVPEAAAASSPPLLLMLHGGGGNADQFRRSSGMDAVADRSGFAVLYAEGTPARGTQEVRTWNAMACCGRALDRQTDDVGFLGELLEGALDRWPIDPTRVGVAGHSNGAMMAYRLAAERSDLVASAMAVAGAIGGQVDEEAPLRIIPEPAEPVSILIVHANDDDHVPFAGGHGTAAVDGPRVDTSVAEARGFWRAADGIPDLEDDGPTVRADGAFEWRDGPGRRGTVVHLIATEGGHGWPGSRAGLNPAPRVPDASHAIGEFLVSNPRAPASPS